MQGVVGKGNHHQHRVHASTTAHEVLQSASIVSTILPTQLLTKDYLSLETIILCHNCTEHNKAY